MTLDTTRALANPEVSWREFYPHVEAEAKAILSPLAEGITLTTNELAERIWPRHESRGADDQKRRQRVYRALFALAENGLAVYCTRQAPEKRPGGTLARPYAWHAAKERPAPASPEPRHEPGNAPGKIEAIGALLLELESYGYECEAGPLTNSQPWQKLKEIVFG